MGAYYILDGHTPVKADLITWARWFENAERHVALAELPGGVQVSTVFLGINHGDGAHAPMLFETMIFGGPDDQFQARCATWAMAEEMHRRAVRRATEGTEMDALLAEDRRWQDQELGRED